MVLAAVGLAAAQTPEPGAVEVSATAASIFNGGIHPAVGAGVGIATTRHVMGVAEFTYIPLGGGVLKPGDFDLLRLTPRTGGKAVDFHGGLHIAVPTGSDRALPYLAVGVGLVRQSFTALGLGHTTTGVAGSFGVGLKWLISERIGVRLELKVYTPNRTFVRVGVSLFYRSR